MQTRSALLCALVFSFSAACGDDGDGKSTVDANGGSADATKSAIDATVADAKVPTSDARVGPDATPSALPCLGAVLPTTVTPPTMLSGVVQEAGFAGTTTMTGEAHVSAHLAATNAVLFEGDFTGAFSFTDADSTTPIDAYLKATRGTYIDTYVYPPYPIFESLANTPIIMIKSSLLPLLSGLTGVDQDSANGILIVAINDCDEAAIEGAVVSITPSVGTIKYAEANNIPGMTDYPSTQSSGIAYIFNVPPGSYTIGATVGAANLRDNTVTAFAGSNTTLAIAP